MPFADEGKWVYDTGQRDYFFFWKHPAGQTIELSPADEAVDDGQWEMIWFNEKGDWNGGLAYGTFDQVQKVARKFMREHPEGATLHDTMKLLQAR